MKITIVGAGYVGLVTAAGFAATLGPPMHLCALALALLSQQEPRDEFDLGAGRLLRGTLVKETAGELFVDLGPTIVTLPRAILLSILIVVALYVVMSTVIIGVIPWTEAQQTRTIASTFVARTFSKAYGMAGLRIGYAIGAENTVKPLARLKMPYNISVFGIAASIAALNDAKHIEEEKARNTEVRNFTIKAFKDMGYKPTDSNANFIFVELKRPAKQFREAVAQHGVLVARDFPPFEKTHCRISFGTMDEMKKAVAVFEDVLKKKATAA